MFSFLPAPSLFFLLLIPFGVVYGIMHDRRELQRLEKEMRDDGESEEDIAEAMKFFRGG